MEDPVTVTVKFFGPLRDQLGEQSIELSLEPEANINDCLGKLYERYPLLREHRDRMAVSLNHELNEDPETVLSPGDELGLLPPFGGGNNMNNNERFRISLVSDPDAFHLSDQIRFVSDPANGGIATFTGSVRGKNEGREVEYLEYDCYEPMARETLRSILKEADEEWNGRGDLWIAAAHRTGRVEVGEPAVLVAVGAPHRAEALEACRYVIDELKGRVALWKKEVFSSGETWVENPETLHRPENES